MIRRLAALLLLVPVPAFGAAPVPGDEPKTPSYFPTRLGAKWTYRIGDQEETFVVTGIKEKNGEKIVSVGEVVEGKVVPRREVKLAADGVFVVAESGRARLVPLTILKLPIKPGDAWEVDTFGPGKIPVKWKTAVHKPEKVKVPGGPFEAIRIEHTYTTPGVDGLPDVVRTRTEWFAPGVGLIREVSRGQEVGALTAFTPGKD